MINNPTQFQVTCDEIAEIDLRMQDLETTRDSHIQDVRENYHMRLEPLKARRKTLLSEAGQYAKKHRKELLGAHKSGETPKAFFGFRMSTPRLATLARVTWEKVIANAKKAGLLQFIRTVEEVDKDRVKAEANPAELEALGCKVTQTESFYVKPKDPGAAKSGKEAA